VIRSKDKGAAAVEFAIILPVLILFLFGIIELSILLFDNAMVNFSLRVGARTAALFKMPISPAKNLAAANQATTFWCQNSLIKFGGPAYTPSLKILKTDGTQVTTQSQFDAISQGDAFKVRLAQPYPYSFLVLFNFIGLGPVNLNSEVLVRKE
jgi:Flp pilus assembly protein TadG